MRPQMFLKATERISQSNIPLLHEVIPVIDIIAGRLVESMADVALPAQVRYGAALGWKLLNKYYSATDESVMYRCAMSTSLICLCNVAAQPRSSAPS